MYKLLIFIIFFCCSCSAIKGNKTSLKRDSLVLKIDFQDGFSAKDDVTLEIEECKIFNLKKFESDSILGFTREEVVAKLINDKVTILFNRDSILCNLTKLKKIKLHIIINGVTTVYNIDLNNGIYIGISNKPIKGCTLYQQKREFQYD